MEFIKQNLEEEWLPVIEQFPKIFLEPSQYVSDCYEKYYKHQDILKEDLVNLRYGFEHGIGWKDLIIGLCQDLQQLADKAISEGNTFQYKGCIIKEKFGQLTPQGDIEQSDGAWEIYRDEYYKILHKWEKQSLTTCEICGKKGTLMGGGWYKTRCEKHSTI